MVSVERTDYAGWSDCLRLENEHVELVVTTAVGPRVVLAGLAGEENLCYLDDDAGTVPDDDEWHLFGGHRLWHAPERTERTLQPDNDAVDAALHDDGVTLAQPTEPATGIRKELSVRLAADAPRATVTHRLVNEGPWPIEVAAWGISVLEPGGTALLPIADRGEGRQADRSIALWPYTDLADDRFTHAEDGIFVRADRERPGAEEGPPETKIGVDGADGWVAYGRDGQVLRKEFVRDPAATYVDRGAAAQVYTNGEICELETLGPLERLEPGGATTHVEEWTLLGGVPVDSGDPSATIDALAPEDAGP